MYQKLGYIEHKMSAVYDVMQHPEYIAKGGGGEVCSFAVDASLI